MVRVGILVSGLSGCCPGGSPQGQGPLSSSCPRPVLVLHPPSPCRSHPHAGSSCGSMWPPSPPSSQTTSAGNTATCVSPSPRSATSDVSHLPCSEALCTSRWCHFHPGTLCETHGSQLSVMAPQITAWWLGSGLRSGPAQLTPRGCFLLSPSHFELGVGMGWGTL